MVPFFLGGTIRRRGVKGPNLRILRSDGRSEDVTASSQKMLEARVLMRDAVFYSLFFLKKFHFNIISQ